MHLCGCSRNQTTGEAGAPPLTAGPRLRNPPSLGRPSSGAALASYLISGRAPAGPRAALGSSGGRWPGPPRSQTPRGRHAWPGWTRGGACSPRPRNWGRGRPHSPQPAPGSAASGPQRRPRAPGRRRAPRRTRPPRQASVRLSLTSTYAFAVQRWASRRSARIAVMSAVKPEEWLFVLSTRSPPRLHACVPSPGPDDGGSGTADGRRDVTRLAPNRVRRAGDLARRLDRGRIAVRTHERPAAEELARGLSQQPGSW